MIAKRIFNQSLENQMNGIRAVSVSVMGVPHKDRILYLNIYFPETTHFY